MMSYLALFPAGIIGGRFYRGKLPIRRRQDLNLRRSCVQALYNEVWLHR